MCMVIVVPAFSSGEESDPPVVARVVFRSESLGSPHVSCGIHQPCGVQAHCDAEKDSPENPRPSSDGEENQGENHQRNPMEASQPNIKAIFGEIRSVFREHTGLAGCASPVDDP